MYKVCNIDIERSDQVFKQIEKYKRKLVARLKVDKIILFGSFASGDINEGSDIDMLVIADWKQSFLDRIKVLLELNRYHLPLEPLGYTKGEFERMLGERNPFIVEVAEKGKVIYNKESA